MLKVRNIDIDLEKLQKYGFGFGRLHNHYCWFWQSENYDTIEIDRDGCVDICVNHFSKHGFVYLDNETIKLLYNLIEKGIFVFDYTD